MVWVVLIRQNLTACDTIRRHGPTQRTLSEHVFNSEAEALDFYQKGKAGLRFAGLAGQYFTYPTKHDSYAASEHFCDECGEGFSIDENDLGFSDLPNGNFCSRACFRNSFQAASEDGGDYSDEQYDDNY